MIRIASLCILLLYHSIIDAQADRPKLFQQLPDTLLIRNDLQDLFTLAEGNSVNKTIAAGFNFQGIVSSRAQLPYRRSIVIRSANYPGATLSISSVTEGNQQVLRGRIISFNHEDAFEIALLNGNYYFIKTDFARLVNE
ncbi:MAG TPA: hypothetical protein VHM26_01705 [Chitinophagaceae bacterium]|nr:hypothetical protein [Chitinophagaceae bacterium]